MRMGVREICDVVFRPLTAVDIGNQHFDAGQPVLYLDTAKTSTLEGAATTVYAQGGKGNPRLIGWDGEKTLTFTVEDALISAVSFSMLSGAGIVKGNSKTGTKIYAHQTYDLVVETKNGGLYAQLPTDVRNGATLVVSKEAPVYATTLDSAGAPRTFLSAITLSEIFTGDDATEGAAYKADAPGELDLQAEDKVWFKLASTEEGRPYSELENGVKAGNTVRIDCYSVHMDGAQEIQIDAESFAGYYYIEADTLFRDEATGQDLPAQFIIPRGKIQSNFTFTMANSGDPSTFTFTIDAFPAYTKFNKRKKVMAALQIIDPTVAGHNYEDKTVIGHKGRSAGVDIYGEGNDLTEGDGDEAKRNRIYDNSIFDEVDGQASDSTSSEKIAAVEADIANGNIDEAKAKAINLTDAEKKQLSTKAQVKLGLKELDENTQAAVDALNDLTATSTAKEVALAYAQYLALNEEQEAIVAQLLSDDVTALLADGGFVVSGNTEPTPEP